MASIRGERKGRQTVVAALCAAVILVILAIAAAAGAGQSARPTFTGVGTLTAVTPESRTVVVEVPLENRVLTVGAQAAPAARLAAGETPIGFESLQPGSRVRIDFRGAPHGPELLALEVLNLPSGMPVAALQPREVSSTGTHEGTSTFGGGASAGRASSHVQVLVPVEQLPRVRVSPDAAPSILVVMPLERFQQLARQEATGEGGAAGTPSGYGVRVTPLDPAFVSRIQQELKQAGFDPGTLTGVMDQQTREALRRFQQSRGLRATGVIDVETRQALLGRSGG